MKLYVGYLPRSAVIARDQNHAIILLRERYQERGVKMRRVNLAEVRTDVPRVLLPPPAETG